MSRSIPAYTNLQEERRMGLKSWERGGVKQPASFYSLCRNPKRKEMKHQDSKGHTIKGELMTQNREVIKAYTRGYPHSEVVSVHCG